MTGMRGKNWRKGTGLTHRYRYQPLPVIAHPTPLQLKTAYRAGRATGACSDSTVKNPYHPADLRHPCWEYGYEIGQKRWALLPAVQEEA